MRSKMFSEFATALLMTLVRYVVAIFGIGLIWHWGAVFAGEAVLPTPGQTLELFVQSLFSAEYQIHLWVSLQRLLIGLLVASVPALALGLCLGHVPWLDRWLSPAVFITYPLPKIVLLPVFFLLFGLGDLSRVMLIALTAGYQVLVIVRAGAVSTDPIYARALTFMGATTWQRVRYVYIPAVLPAFLTALKVASGTAVAVLFLAESFATNTGLGYLIMDAWGMGDTLMMFNGILGMSLLGIALYATVWGIEKLFCSWAR